MTTARTARITTLALSIGLLATFALSATSSALRSNDPAAASPHEVAIALFERVFNNTDDVVASTSLVSTDAEIHTPYGEFSGPEGLLDYLGIIRRGYPDATFAVSAITEQGNSVSITWTMTATQYQIGPNEPVLDVRVRMPGETVLTIADGQIASLTQASETAVVDPPVEIAASRLQWP